MNSITHRRCSENLSKQERDFELHIKESNSLIFRIFEYNKAKKIDKNVTAKSVISIIVTLFIISRTMQFHKTLWPISVLLYICIFIYFITTISCINTQMLIRTLGTFSSLFRLMNSCIYYIGIILIHNKNESYANLNKNGNNMDKVALIVFGIIHVIMGNTSLIIVAVVDGFDMKPINRFMTCLVFTLSYVLLMIPLISKQYTEDVIFQIPISFLNTEYSLINILISAVWNIILFTLNQMFKVFWYHCIKGEFKATVISVNPLVIRHQKQIVKVQPMPLHVNEE